MTAPAGKYIGWVGVDGTVTAEIVGPVEVEGAVSIDGTVTVDGTVAIDGTVPIEGSVSIEGAVAVTGDVNATPATVGLTALVFSKSAAGDQTLIAAPGLGLRIYVYRMLYAATGGANTWKLKSNATVISMDFPVALNEKGGLDQSSDPWFSCAANEPLVLNLASALTLQGEIWYKVGP